MGVKAIKRLTYVALDLTPEIEVLRTPKEAKKNVCRRNRNLLKSKMEMKTICNEELRVTVSAAGAEVQSLQDVKTGREYLWQGDERWWGGRSPILFPICGGLWNGVCRIDGKEVAIPKHGFVRQRVWRATEEKADSVRFEYISTVGDFETFPFAFHLAVTYRLEGRTLFADFEVLNTGGCDLWFQMGGHPAIALPDWKEEQELDGYLRLEGKPEYIWRAGDQGCLEPEKHEVPFNEEGLVPLTVATFANEALIFDRHQVTAATVLDLQHQPVARVASESDGWLFWSPTGLHSPFVCCEPWYGLPDHQGFEGPISERPHIQMARSGETWKGGYSVEVF